MAIFRSKLIFGVVVFLSGILFWYFFLHLIRDSHIRIIAIAAFVVTGDVVAAMQTPKERRRWGLVKGSVGVFTALLCVSYAEEVVAALSVVDNPLAKASLAATACLLVGGALFWFRLKQRIAYGVTEVIVGAYIAWTKGHDTPGTALAAANDGAFLMASLTASVYLVVRGCDNVYVGWKARPTKP